MIISFTGCDGAGKSTQVKRVRDWLEHQGYQVKILDKWDILDQGKFPECRFLKPDLEDLRVCIAEMEGPSRPLFLFWSIAITLSKADFTDPNVIYLLDGYWMKHAASEILYGSDPTWIEETVRQLPLSDLVIYFDIDPELAANRKEEFTPYECGRVLDFTRSDFIHHQTKLRELMLNWANVYGWQCIASDQDANQITKQLVQVIETRLQYRQV